MNWNDIKRVFPKCPAKSIYQYRSDVFPVWWNFSGYGKTGHGTDISGFWDCVFTFSVVEDPVELANSVKPNGLLIYRGSELTDKRFACIYNQEYLIYKRVL